MNPNTLLSPFMFKSVIKDVELVLDLVSGDILAI